MCDAEKPDGNPAQRKPFKYLARVHVKLRKQAMLL